MNRILYLGLIIFLLIPEWSKAQYVSEIIDYHPAPGQLINTESFGSPQAAQSIIGQINGLVSLGAFGGSITIKMEEPVENDPLNPYGIDFTIFGNAMPNWSEAGAVQVMKDENQNGLADDEWYILAASDYYFQSTIIDFQLEYFKPGNDDDNILWIDQNQDSGYVFVNNIHQHPYYPQSNYFPGINQNSEYYNAQFIEGLMDYSNPAYVRSYKRGFGYADNQARGIAPWDIPDNPYTEVIENSGGDGFDISWARNENGERVILDRIDFVKISTALNANGNQLGEISTEISGIIDVTPNPDITGTNQCIIMENIPKRMLVNSEFSLHAIYFKEGIPADNQQINWISSSNDIAQIQDQILKTQQVGIFTLEASSVENQEISQHTEIHVITPSQIELFNANPFLLPEEETDIYTKITDNEGFIISNLNLLFEVSDESIIQITQNNQSLSLKALDEGESWLIVSLEDFPSIKDSVLFHVSEQSQLTKAFVCIKSENQIIMPRQSVAITPDNLDHYIEANSPDFHSQEINSENLAQLIISSFRAMGLNEEFRFKNDLENNKVYLWKVPVESGTSLEYIYGYGGRTESPYERCWIVKLNDENISRDFHEIPIRNNDEITIYHVNNINESWTLKEFKSLNDSVPQKGDIHVILEEFDLQMYANAQVYTLDHRSIPDRLIYDNNNELWYNENQVITNSEGQANFQLNQLGEHIISADGEEILIHVNQATAIDEIAKPSIHIFPNPVKNDLNLQLNEGQIQEIKIYNLAGQIIFYSNDSKSVINVSNLRPGNYLLHIRTKNSVYNQSFVRQ